ncbi:hypothetical protein [Halomarina rubra]|uniref:Uncharacterized protein n=1 Tax=Halomarina rubra TaxID=2071873 RepID=A0ABD6AVL4_9EURY|nr:hypothetical protein [Halomarina rubra]
MIDGLSYDEDVRKVDPERNYRRGRFKKGWNDAVDGKEYGEETLRTLTWENLGWRIGSIVGEANEHRQQEVYSQLVKIQLDE